MKLLLFILTLFCSCAQVAHEQVTPGSAAPLVVYGSGAIIATLDVGQGECNVVRLPGGASMVVDCGSSGGMQWPTQQAVIEIRKKIAAVTGDPTGVDVLVLSHPDKDHYNLVADVFSASSGFGVGQVFLVGQPSEYSVNGTSSWIGLQNWNSITVNQFQPNSLSLLTGGGASVTALAAGVGSTKNDRSAVLLVEHGQFEGLLPADATGKTNDFLYQEFQNELDDTVDYFKIEHHGANSKSSDSPWFIGWIQPSVSVASCAQHLGNGHPRLDVIQDCRQYALQVPASHNIMTYDPAAGWQQLTINDAVYSTFSTDDFRIWTDANGIQYQFQPGSIH